MTGFINGVLDVEKIELKGSVLTPNLLDLTFIYPPRRGAHCASVNVPSFADKIEGTVNRFWFMSSFCDILNTLFHAAKHMNEMCARLKINGGVFVGVRNFGKQHAV